jgi:hypothetical protein
MAGAVQKAIKEGIPGVEIKKDKRIREICANISTEDGSLKRPDLAFEAGIQRMSSCRTKPTLNLAEIASPGPWIDAEDKEIDQKT